MLSKNFRLPCIIWRRVAPLLRRGGGPPMNIFHANHVAARCVVGSNFTARFSEAASDIENVNNGPPICTSRHLPSRAIRPSARAPSVTTTWGVRDDHCTRPSGDETRTYAAAYAVVFDNRAATGCDEVCRRVVFGGGRRLRRTAILLKTLAHVMLRF